REESGLVISQDNIELLHSFSRPDGDPPGWVVTVSYLAFIGEEPLIAGDDAKELHWFNLERHDQHITLSHQDVEITLALQKSA
ncbi:NUDIX hydrolase, partial [Enterococcus faecalis]